jgi:hypothetical protein
MSKAQSDQTTNPTGLVSTSTKRLAAILRVPTERISAALELLAEGELVSVDNGRLGTVRVTLAAFDAWQYPTGHPTERKRRSRASLQAKSVPESQPVTAGHIASLHHTTPHHTTQHNTEPVERARPQNTGTGSGDNLRNLETVSAIGGTRRKLGTLSMVVDQLADKYNGRWADATLLQNVYHPTLVCLNQYGEAVTGEALLAAIEKPPDQPRTWLPKVCATIAERAAGHLQAVEAKRESYAERAAKRLRDAGLA